MRTSILHISILLVLFSCNKQPASYEDAIPNAKAANLATYPEGLKAFGQDVHAAIERSIVSGTLSIPDTTQKVYIQFVVDKKGTIQPVKVEAVPPISYAPEILRCVQETKRWLPAKDENGNAINVSMTLPVTMKGKYGDVDISSHCTQASDLIKSVAGKDSSIIIIIPYNGCSGCINTSIEFVKDVSDRYPEYIIGILTGFQSPQEVEVFNQNYLYDLNDYFIVDQELRYIQMLPDINLPFVAVVNNGSIDLCRILNASNIHKTVIELEAHFVLIEEDEKMREKEN